MYQCPGAAGTKYHQLGGLKQQQFIFSQFWRLKVKNQGVGRVMHFLKFWDNFLSCLFQLLAVPGIPSLVAV